MQHMRELKSWEKTRSESESPEEIQRLFRKRWISCAIAFVLVWVALATAALVGKWMPQYGFAVTAASILLGGSCVIYVVLRYRCPRCHSTPKFSQAGTTGVPLFPSQCASCGAPLMPNHPLSQ